MRRKKKRPPEFIPGAFSFSMEERGQKVSRAANSILRDWVKVPEYIPKVDEFWRFALTVAASNLTEFVKLNAYALKRRPRRSEIRMVLFTPASIPK